MVFSDLEFLLAAALASSALALRNRRPTTASTAGILAGLLWLFGGWDVLRTLHPLFWKLEQATAHGLSMFAGFLGQVEIRSGSTYSGLLLTLVFLLFYWLGLSAVSRRSLGWPFRLGLGMLPLATHVVFLVTAATLQEAASREFVGVDPRWLELLLLGRITADIVVLIVVVWVLRRSFKPVVEDPVRMHFGRAVNLLSLAALTGFALHTVSVGHAASKIPERPRLLTFHPRDGTAFRELLDRAEEWGFEVCCIESLSDLNPPAHNGDCLALLFPFAVPWHEESDSILESLRNGAGLLLAVDHTMQHPPLDQLLQEFGLAMCFDSAYPIRRAEFQWHRHPLRAAWQERAAFPYGVGASFTIPSRGSILFVGTNHFSDRGDLEGRPGNFLGSRRYEPGEVLGDRVLAAEVDYGRGRVVVVGDPGQFYSDELPWSQHWVRAVLTYLCSREKGILAGEILRVLTAIFLVASVVLWFRDRAAVPWSAALWAVALPLLESGAPRWNPGSSAVTVPHVVVDTTWFEEFSLPRGSGRSVNGLCESLQKVGVRVDIGRRSEHPDLGTGDGLVLIGPRARPLPDEVDAVLAFVEGGGHLLIAAGWRHASAIEPFLQQAEIRIVPRLAKETQGWADALRRGSGPVSFLEAYELEVGHANSVVLAEYEGVPVCVKTPVGQGSITVLGDPLFLLGENLSYRGGSFERNEALLLAALELRP